MRNALSAMQVAALLLACSLAGCMNNEAQVGFAVFKENSTQTLPQVRVIFDDGERRLRLDPSDFPQNRMVGPFDTENDGELDIMVFVLNSEGDSVTEGELTLPLKKDWRYGVSIHVSESDPISGCFGCEGSISFDLAPELGFSPQGKLFLLWGGNSISDPVTF